MTESAALASLLAAEHAAIYAYGVLGARLDAPTRAVALAAFNEHRMQRNSLEVVLRSRQIAAPGPAGAYAVSVANRLEALHLAVKVETELGVRWRDLMGLTDEVPLRRLAVDGLQDSAMRAVRWRQLAKVVPLTEPFPGQA